MTLQPSNEITFEQPMIRAWVIAASHETERAAHIQLLAAQLPGLQQMEAIYPTRQKVPFLSRLIALTKQRTGTALNKGEIGVLLSNRAIWKRIVKEARSESEHFLILESDSVVNDVVMLHQQYPSVEKDYDLFFWGAWLGHAQILRSTKRKVQLSTPHPSPESARTTYAMGTPFYKTICSGYGYSLNKKAAAYLLKRSNKIAYPVDEFKRYANPHDLRWGTILPEIISQGKGTTTIGHSANPLLEKIWISLLDIRNAVICFFN